MNLSRLSRRLAWTVAAALAALGVSAPANAAAQIVISQVYSGGGSSSASASYQHDYVELYNRGDAAGELLGLSLQYASATGTFNAAAALPAFSLQPGQYYLVRLGNAGTGGAVLEGADATGNLNMGAANGKVALVNGTAALGSTVDCEGANAVALDLVGWGTATCFEGSGPVAALSISTAALRNGTPRGSVDSNDNAADFTVGTPDPRNSTFGQTPGPAVSDVTFNPAAVDPGQSTTITATVTPVDGTTITSVTANTSSVGGTTVNLTNAGGNTWTGQITVAAGTSAGPKSIAVTATDSAGKTGSANGTLTVNQAGGPLTIAAARAAAAGATVTTRGIVTATTTSTVYIQDATGGINIFDGSSNNGIPGLAVGDDVTVTGVRENFRGDEQINISGTPAPAFTVNSQGNALPAAQVLTIPQIEADTNGDLEGRITTVNQLTVLNVMTRTNSSTQFYLTVMQDASGNKVSMAIHRNATTSPFAEFTDPFPAGRTPIPVEGTADDSGGGLTFPTINPGDIFNVTGILTEDTSNGGYITGAPSKLIRPRWNEDLVKVGSALITSATATPNPVERGTDVTLRVTTNPPTGSTVTANLTAFGGSATQALTFNPADNSYTYTFTIPATQTLGGASIPIAVTNGSANQTSSIPLSITTTEPITIAAARALPDNTDRVTVQGVITSTQSGSTNRVYYIQDATGGLMLFSSNSNINGNEGDVFRVTGRKITFQGLVELDYGTGADGSFEFVGTDAVPTPQALTLAQWNETTAGELSTTNSLLITATRNAGANRIFTVTDGTASGEIFITGTAIDLTGATPTKFSQANLDAMTVGSAWNVTGIVEKNIFNNVTTWQIRPRRPSDVVPGTPPAAVKGDVDKNSTVNAADAIMALRVAGGLQSGSDTAVSILNGDVAPAGAPDGRITLMDAVRILRSINNLGAL